MRLKADASCKVINGHNQPNGCPGIFFTTGWRKRTVGIHLDYYSILTCTCQELFQLTYKRFEYIAAFLEILEYTVACSGRGHYTAFTLRSDLCCEFNSVSEVRNVVETVIICGISIGQHIVNTFS